MQAALAVDDIGPQGQGLPKSCRESVQRCNVGLFSKETILLSQTVQGPVQLSHTLAKSQSKVLLQD
jgi:hypothetical protein